MSNQITALQALSNDLQRMAPQFQKALPSHISVDKFIRTVQTAISTNPDLANANKQSLFASCLKSASVGLLPDGSESAIVTFKDKSGTPHATFMPMIKGILKLVRNSGDLASITSQVVYEKDEFSFYIDTSGEHLMHKPNMFVDRGKAVGVYALAKTKDGAVYIEVMTMDEIKSVENCSRGKQGPWSGPFRGEMIRKTVLKRLAKRLPMSTDLDSAMRADDELYERDHEVERAVPEKPKAQGEPPPQDVTAPKQLNKLMGAQPETPQPPTKKEIKNHAPGMDETPI
jgi:recombination protein RecT